MNSRNTAKLMSAFFFPANTLWREEEMSLRTFREFLVVQPDGSIDASRVISEECFQRWMTSTKPKSKVPRFTFRRALHSHLSGIDGRKPFKEDEEAALLVVVRSKEAWKVLEWGEEGKCGSELGKLAFRAKGYHEKRRLMEAEQEVPSKRVKVENESTYEERPDTLSSSSFFSFTGAVMNRFDFGTLQAVVSFHNFLRMFLLSRGMIVLASKEEGQRLVEQYSEPGRVLMVMNPSGSFENRIIACNALCKQIVGDVVENSATQVPFRWTHIPKLIVYYAELAHSQPGTWGPWTYADIIHLEKGYAPVKVKGLQDASTGLFLASCELIDTDN